MKLFLVLFLSVTLVLSSQGFVYTTNGVPEVDSFRVLNSPVIDSDVINKGYLNEVVANITSTFTAEIEALKARLPFLIIRAYKFVNPGPSFVFHFVNESPGALVFANSQQASGNPYLVSIYGRTDSSVNVWTTDYGSSAESADVVHVITMEFKAYTHANVFTVSQVSSTSTVTFPSMGDPTIFLQGEQKSQSMTVPVDCRVNLPPSSTSASLKCYDEQTKSSAANVETIQIAAFYAVTPFDANFIQFGQTSSLTVVFPQEFASPPVVTITIEEGNGSGPSVCSVTTLSTTGFTFLCRWTSTGPADLYSWLAVLENSESVLQ